MKAEEIHHVDTGSMAMREVTRLSQSRRVAKEDGREEIHHGDTGSTGEEARAGVAPKSEEIENIIKSWSARYRQPVSEFAMLSELLDSITSHFVASAQRSDRVLTRNEVLTIELNQARLEAWERTQECDVAIRERDLLAGSLRASQEHSAQLQARLNELVRAAQGEEGQDSRSGAAPQSQEEISPQRHGEHGEENSQGLEEEVIGLRAVLRAYESVTDKMVERRAEDRNTINVLLRERGEAREQVSELRQERDQARGHAARLRARLNELVRLAQGEEGQDSRRDAAPQREGDLSALNAARARRGMPLFPEMDFSLFVTSTEKQDKEEIHLGRTAAGMVRALAAGKRLFILANDLEPASLDGMPGYFYTGERPPN